MTNKWQYILGTLGVAMSTVTVISILPEKEIDLKEIIKEPLPIEESCGFFSNDFYVKFDKKGNAEEKICITDKDYSKVKAALLTEFNDKKKDYDFDINHREILSAVVNKEVKEKGFRIEGDITKEKLREEIINLLK